MSAAPQHNPLMMEIEPVSETLDTGPTLTWLMARESFISYKAWKEFAHDIYVNIAPIYRG
jgi:hypothetical protein